jgi:hypothetical protein
MSKMGEVKILKLPTMKSINQCVQVFKESDPDTGIRYHSIKKMCEDGRVAHTLIGAKVLVNFDDLLAKLVG